MYLQRSFVFAVIVSLMLAGCGTAPTPIPIPTLTPIQPTSTPIPTETPIPTVTHTPFVPKATFKIAVHVPMTGNLSGLGVDMFRASELAAAQLNKPLESMGYAVELVSYDDMGDLDTAVSNAKTLVNDPQILCGVGHFTSYLTINASEVYHQAGLAFISPSATNPEVTSKGYLEISRVIGLDNGQGFAGVKFALERGFKTVYVLDNGDPYGQGNAGYFIQAAKQLGLPIAGKSFAGAAENYAETINKVIQANTDLIYFAGYVDQAGAFVKEARALGYTGAVLGPDSMDNPELVNLAGPFAIDGGGMYYIRIGAGASTYPSLAKFIADFQAQFNADPQMYAANAYDATGVCLKAIEEASKTRGGEIPTRAEVAAAVRALVDYPGVSGTYTFDEKGDLIAAAYQIIQVTTIDPGKWAANPVAASYEIGPPEK